MEVRFETMLFMFDNKISEMLLTLVNTITLAGNEEELRESIKKFAETNELDKFFAYGYGSHHFYMHQRYTSNPDMVLANRLLSVHF
ncbi:hypothetical protein [Parabacteroides bouchesdurhonensis]|uniref:hypothetical protein n=1 Tax=Parabacteroides bouchesdurhonensis TaxID=1936995 RepID=UPI000E4C7149|nr:hypothetical protein [Parabacteroides bouchesdurhonensis]RHJ95080.1 hypothetical protein DW095_01215 [Bacteroides sp. AM07-16]